MRSTKLVVPLLALMFVGCVKNVDPYLVSGITGDETGKLFLTAVELWKTARNDGVVSELQYQKWKEFGTRFQKLYPVTFELWDTAVQQKNQPVMDQMKAMLVTLARELTDFMNEVTKAKTEMHQPPKEQT